MADMPTETEIVRAIFDNPNISIIATGPDGKILTWNAGAEKMLGYTAEEMIGKATPEIIHDKAEVRMQAAQMSKEYGVKVETGFHTFVAPADISGAIQAKEWTYIRKDGSRFRGVLGVSILRSRTGAMQGYIGICMPVAERS